MATAATTVTTYSPTSGTNVAATLDASDRVIQHTVLMSPFITYQDDASASVSYFGTALPGTATSAAAWRIMKKNVSGAITSYTYAAGSTEFTQIWDNRAGLAYS